MANLEDLAIVDKHPEIARAAPQVFMVAMGETDRGVFFREALPFLEKAMGCEDLSVLRGEKGAWRVLGTTGKSPAPPETLLGEVLDENAAKFDHGWAAAPFPSAAPYGTVLAAYNHQADSLQFVSQLDAAAAVLAPAMQCIQDRTRQRRRVQRLESMLEVAAQWRQTMEMDQLLTKMAEAATRLLDAERASIFLWDRPSKTLVARPALGVEENELRIPDNAGVVGQVVHSGQSRRVDEDIAADQRDIDRSVDQKLSFKTRSLLCAPLRDADGRILGAFEMINKTSGNFTDEDETALQELAAHAAVALQNTQQYEHLLRSRNQMADQAAQDIELIGDCPAIEKLRQTVRRIADTELAVLVLGENGTGKEVVSRMIHYHSRRRNEPLLAVNCAALAENLLESELFGHEKGAFTDAHEARAGKFELASGGTLFLDEIGDMSPGGQAKLLRVLEEKVVVRVGASTPIHTDARVIAATNQNLAEMVREKAFREDLFFRLNTVTLELPPLRERGDDILLLAERFLRDFCVKARRQPPRLTAAARKRLLNHRWPGNVRELRNMMERLAYMSEGDRVEPHDLAFIISPTAEDSPLDDLDRSLTEATKHFQSDYIRRQIERARGNMTDAAKNLGLHRSNLYRKMHQLNMEVNEDG